MLEIAHISSMIWQVLVPYSAQLIYPSPRMPSCKMGRHVYMIDMIMILPVLLHSYRSMLRAALGDQLLKLLWSILTYYHSIGWWDEILPLSLLSPASSSREIPIRWVCFSGQRESGLTVLRERLSNPYVVFVTAEHGLGAPLWESMSFSTIFLSQCSDCALFNQFRGRDCLFLFIN